MSIRRHRQAAAGLVIETRPGPCDDRTRRLNDPTLPNGKRWQWFGQSPRGYSVGGKFQDGRRSYKAGKRIRTRREDRQVERGGDE